MSELVGSVFIGLADVITDGIAYARLSSDVAVRNEGVKTAYEAILCAGVVTTVLSLVYRLRNARLMRAQLRELSQQHRKGSSSAIRSQAQQHEFELAQTHRTKVLLSLSLLCVLAQGVLALRAVADVQFTPCDLLFAPGLPMSGLNCYLIFNDGVADHMVRTFRAMAATCREALGRVHATRELAQVFASLLVSVLLVGLKLNATKEIVQIVERRKELRANLSLLQKKLEEEDTKIWIVDVAHDTKQRADRIAELESASGRSVGLVYSTMESGAVERCLGMFTLFDGISAAATQLLHSVTITRSETKYDAATGLLLGRAEAEIRADPLEIVAYVLCCDSRAIQSVNAADRSTVRFELLENVSAHHTVAFGRYKLPGMSDRTFLVSAIAKQVGPRTYAVAVVPIPSHDKIGPKDETGAVRCEVRRSFRCTEVAPGVTKLEFCCSLDLRGLVPQSVTNRIAVPAMLGLMNTQSQYFQQLRALGKCDADDGRIVGQMLVELIKSKPKDLAHAIQTFVNRTTMLRECSFRHIGAMLTRLLSPDAQGGSDNAAAILNRDPSSLMEEQATAIGSAIASSVRQSHVPVTAVRHAVQSHAVLRAMKSTYVWFVPMLEAVAVGNSESRRTLMKRLSSIATAEVPTVAPNDATSSADGADNEEFNQFSSVV